MAMKGLGIHQVEMDFSWGRINFYMCMCVQVCTFVGKTMRDGVVICPPHY